MNLPDASKEKLKIIASLSQEDQKKKISEFTQNIENNREELIKALMEKHTGKAEYSVFADRLVGLIKAEIEKIPLYKDEDKTKAIDRIELKVGLYELISFHINTRGRSPDTVYMINTGLKRNPENTKAFLNEHKEEFIEILKEEKKGKYGLSADSEAGKWLQAQLSETHTSQ